MRTYLFIRRIVIVTLLVLISWLPALATQVVNQPSGGPPPFVSTEGLGIVAGSAIEDTLKACLARIAKDATVGQRMLAEQKCAQEEGIRKVVQAAPKF